MHSIMDVLDQIAIALFNTMQPGYDDIVIETSKCALACRRTKPTEMAGKRLTAGDAAVQFPSGEHMFGKEKQYQMDFVDIQVKSAG